MKTVTELFAEFKAAYADLTELLRHAANADAQLMTAQTDLANARAAIILRTDTKALGANEALREAALAERTHGERACVLSCEAHRTSLRYRVEIARLRVDHAKCALRLVEVEAKNYDGLNELAHAGF